MDVTVDILRGELERLFSLDDLTALSRDLLGLDPTDVGGEAAKASFARALAERCLDGDRVDALVDCILFRKKSVDPRVFEAVARWGKESLEPGKQIGPFTLKEAARESELAFVGQAEREGEADARYMLKILKRASHGDRRAVQRFLTANRLASAISHPGIAPNLTAGELADGTAYVAYRSVDGETLQERLQRKGPASFAELRPILKSILEALAALHATGLVHGDLKLDHVVVTAEGRAVLVDFGGDKLRRPTLPVNGKGGGLFGGGPGVAPEVLRGKAADARSDLYALGAMVYELATGKPVFEGETLADLALAHLTAQPEAPSVKAPPGFAGKDLDSFVLPLLEKEPSKRPRDAQAAMDALDRLGGATGEVQAIGGAAVEGLVAALLAEPKDVEAALALENAVASGADPKVVGDAFARAAASIAGIAPSDQEAKRSLLYRAGRTFDVYARDKEQAESVYLALVSLDPNDDVAHSALSDLRRQLGKYDELVESLLERSQNAAAGEPRARVFAEIGRLYAAELEDPEQALVAYTQAFGEQPVPLYALEIERLAGTSGASWTEVLSSATESIQALDASDANRTKLLEYVAHWYQQHLGRSDLALMAYQQILATEPANEKANLGLTGIYRSAQQWPELSTLLLARAEANALTPRARDLRVEAAEIVETKLNDPARAREVYEKILAEDPGHVRAGDALFRLAEKAGDFDTLVRILEQRASARGGAERLDAMVRAAEIYEDHLNDIAEASRRFEAVLSADPKNMNALRGLDRIYNRTGKYRELLDTLERQVQAAATPRQKMGLYERIAALHDEEFLDHQGAIDALGKVLALDPNNDSALSALVRHYRATDRWDKVVETLEQHVNSASDNARKAELLLSKARVLAEQIGSPERAMKAYEAVLSLSPSHAGALEALAQLKEVTGDSHAALSAIEALAQKAETPDARAEQWMRAGRLLEARGDKDGAIARYTRALDAKPGDVAASSALRKAYRDRGDAGSVVALIEQELKGSDNELQKARLYSELALLYKSELKQNENAEAAAKKAVELDPSSAEALLVLGDLAFEAGRFLDAVKILESLVGRVQVLPSKEDGVRVLVRYVESFGKTQVKPERPTQVDVAGPSSQGPMSVPPPRETNPRLGLAVEALRKFAPTDVAALTLAANVLFEHGDPASVTKLWRDVFAEHDARLAGKERSEALYQLGESARRSGEAKEAVAPLVEAAKLAPADPRPLRSLSRIYDDLGDFESSLKLRRRRLELLGATERFDLLLEIGDIEFQKLSDRARAERSYGEALEIRPDDRKLLAKLMQLYSEEKDWAKLLEVVTRLAGFVDDPKQRAKYMHTAATISSRYLEDDHRALEFYAKVLENDPSLLKAAEEAAELYKKVGNYDASERMLQIVLDLAKDDGDRDRMVVVLDELADLYRRFLKEPELAIDALEAAQAFDPDGKDRSETLAELYASDPEQYLDKAVRAQAQLLQQNPYRVESYKLLRKLYTDTKHADPAWCLCQALAVLNLAEPDEERFYTRYRSKTAAPAQAVLADADWDNLLHPDADPTLTKLFALLEPVIRRSRTQPLEQLGFDPRYAIDTSMHPYPISQTLYYAQGVLGLGQIKVFQQLADAPQQGQFVDFIHASEPGIVLGRSAFESTLEAQPLTFLLGRHLSYYRPGHYVRHLVPSGTGLKAWLFAGIKLCVPNFPVAADLQGPVAEATQHLVAALTPNDKDNLASVVSRLLREAPALDLKKWVAGIDFSADRTGFLLAHDLDAAAGVIRENPLGEAGLPTKERMKELVLFGVSESYFALRKSLSVAIDS